MQWHRVAALGEVKEGEPKGIKIGGLHIGLYKINGKLYAIEDVCPHEFGLLSGGWLEGEVIECPLHQARFHIPTGRLVCPPARRHLKTYPVQIEGDQVYVGIESP